MEENGLEYHGKMFGLAPPESSSLRKSIAPRERLREPEDDYRYYDALGFETDRLSNHDEDLRRESIDARRDEQRLWHGDDGEHGT